MNTKNSKWILGAVATVAWAAGPAMAGPLGFYVGAGAMRAESHGGLPANSTYLALSEESKSTGWKAVAGIKPLPLLGVEAAYTDFGSESAGSPWAVSSSLNALGVSALIHLPIPLPVLDVYGKVGYARLNGEMRGGGSPAVACPAVVPTTRYCGPAFRIDLDNDAPVAGIGGALRFGAWGLRAEYETWMVSGSDHRTASLLVTRSFF